VGSFCAGEVDGVLWRCLAHSRLLRRWTIWFSKNAGEGEGAVSPFNVRGCAAAVGFAHQKLESFDFRQGMLHLFLFL
jgi:hypothetical protein